MTEGLFERLPEGVRVVRRVRAARADVFDAWVNRDRLRSWFGPSGTRVVELGGELSVGHEYRFLLRDESGQTTELWWTFREISPPERLVFGWRLSADGRPITEESTVAVSFRSDGGWTEVEIAHTDVVSDEERDGHARGWIGCLDELEAILTQLG